MSILRGVGSYVDGKYKVLDKIGQGGMSVVYLALNEKANKTVGPSKKSEKMDADFPAVNRG